MYKKLLVACLLCLSTTAILAEEPGPNQPLQIEKVGELYGMADAFVPEKKNISIRISPLSILDGITKLSLNYAVTNKISLGLEGLYVTSPAVFKSAVKEASSSEGLADNLDYTAQSYGVRADYALDGLIFADKTLYLSGGLSKVMVGVKSRIEGTEASGVALFGRAMIGVQWVKKHFMVNLAYGISTILSEENKLKTSSGWVSSEDQFKNMGSYEAFEFSVGYVF
jgi:hypothetical protein